MQATIAAAVVKDPAGSGNTETSKGGTIDFLAVSSMSRAKDASLPHIKTPVYFALETDLEKMAS